MSLDVYLNMKNQKIIERPKIFIRENGETKGITRKEWDDKFPGKDPYIVTEEDSDKVFWRNITHNLGGMASEAGIYKHLWCPGEIGITKANQLIEPLMTGLMLLKNDPERFKKFNPENGWGSYEVLVEFVKAYLNACQEYPNADISVRR